MTELASVSECISPGPANWIDEWRHNNAFFYESPADARSVVPEAGASDYRLYAYRMLTESFGSYDDATSVDVNVTPAEIDDSFIFAGYDVVSRSYASNFECSPLSCNEMGAEVPVNEYCLIDRLDEAIRFAQRCGEEQPEPGVYYVLEVWRGPAC